MLKLRRLEHQQSISKNAHALQTSRACFCIMNLRTNMDEAMGDHGIQMIPRLPIAASFCMGLFLLALMLGICLLHFHLGFACIGQLISEQDHTMRFGSTAKVLAECKLQYYRI